MRPPPPGCAPGGAAGGAAGGPALDESALGHARGAAERLEVDNAGARCAQAGGRGGRGAGEQGPDVFANLGCEGISENSELSCLVLHESLQLLTRSAVGCPVWGSSMGGPKFDPLKFCQNLGTQASDSVVHRPSWSRSRYSRSPIRRIRAGTSEQQTIVQTRALNAHFRATFLLIKLRDGHGRPPTRHPMESYPSEKPKPCRGRRGPEVA